MKLFYFFISLVLFLYAIVCIHREVIFIFIFISGTFIFYFSFPLTLISKFKFSLNYLLSLVLKHINGISVPTIVLFIQLYNYFIVAERSFVIALYSLRNRLLSANCSISAGYFAIADRQTRISDVYFPAADEQTRMWDGYFPFADRQTRMRDGYYSSADRRTRMWVDYFASADGRTCMWDVYFPAADGRTQMSAGYFHVSVANFPKEIFWNLQVSVNSFDLFSGPGKLLFRPKNYFKSFLFLIVNTLSHSGYCIQLTGNFIHFYNLYLRNILYKLFLALGKIGQKVCPKFLLPQNVQLQCTYFLTFKTLEI